MTASRSTFEFLHDYQTASAGIGLAGTQHLDPERQADNLELQGQARELVSRCILSDDPRVFIHLVTQLAIALAVANRPNAAEAFNLVAQRLTQNYLDLGTL